MDMGQIYVTPVISAASVQATHDCELDPTNFSTHEKGWKGSFLTTKKAMFVIIGSTWTKAMWNRGCDKEKNWKRLSSIF